MDEDLVCQNFLVLPSDANSHGTLFGGRLLASLDITSAIAGMRLARGPVVTASMDKVDFKIPVHIGDIVTIKAKVIRIGRTSMQIKAEAFGFKQSGEEIGLICSAFITMVAVDKNGKPREILKNNK